MARHWLLTILEQEAPVGDVREGINDAAAWLVANGHSDLSLDETTLVLGTILAEAQESGAFSGIEDERA